mmetsp:Transcript_9043/g.22116  ORF Transcript_9043/g.22116 Transcript_9043/m.22116 type:complete len:426 (-) Transcript_9043:810-2087(-)
MIHRYHRAHHPEFLDRPQHEAAVPFHQLPNRERHARGQTPTRLQQNQPQPLARVPMSLLSRKIFSSCAEEGLLVRGGLIQAVVDGFFDLRKRVLLPARRFLLLDHPLQVADLEAVAAHLLAVPLRQFVVVERHHQVATVILVVDLVALLRLLLVVVFVFVRTFAPRASSRRCSCCSPLLLHARGVHNYARHVREQQVAHGVFGRQDAIFLHDFLLDPKNPPTCYLLHNFFILVLLAIDHAPGCGSFRFGLLGLIFIGRFRSVVLLVFSITYHCSPHLRPATRSCTCYKVVQHHAVPAARLYRQEDPRRFLPIRRLAPHRLPHLLGPLHLHRIHAETPSGRTSSSDVCASTKSRRSERVRAETDVHHAPRKRFPLRPPVRLAHDLPRRLVEAEKQRVGYDRKDAVIVLAHLVPVEVPRVVVEVRPM